MVRAFALAFLLTAAAAHAVPPPPAPYPKGMPIEVGGYRMDQVYTAYHSWLNRSREEALKAAFRSTATIRALHYWDTPFRSEIRSYDYGVIRIDMLTRSCTGRRDERQPPGRCFDKYRYAMIPGSLLGNEANDAAIAASFKTGQLAAMMKAAAIPASGDYWGGRMTSLFAAMTDPKEFWAPKVVVRSVDTEACPGLKMAVADLVGNMTVALAPPNAKSSDFAPHGTHSWITISSSIDGDRPVNLEGADALYPLARPIWEAAERCAPMQFTK